MCSHSKKQDNGRDRFPASVASLTGKAVTSGFSKTFRLRLLLIAVMAVFAAWSSTKAQQDLLHSSISLTVNPVSPPYTNKLSDYFSTPGKIGGTMIVKQNIHATSLSFYVHVAIVNMETENMVRTRRTFKPARPRDITLEYPPVTTVLTQSDIAEAVREQNLEYVGFTREQILREGLPAGSYQICMTLFVHPGGWNNVEQLRTYCSPTFRIEEKEPVINQTVQVLPPYTNKLSDYLESPGKIQSVITVTQYPDNQARFEVTGRLEQVDGNIRIRSAQHSTSVRIDGTPSGNGVVFPPYTLTPTNYREMFREPMVYQGITREQVLRDGLPEGNYRICFMLSDERTGKNLGSYCSAPFQIRKKDPVVNQTVNVLPPYTNKLSDYFEAPGKIQSVITVTQYPENQADLDMTATLEQVDGNIRIGSGQHMAPVRIKGTPSGNNVIFPPYTLTHNDYRNVFKEPMVYQGITREQVQRNGLPEGTYRICFRLRKSHSTVVLGSYCSAPFQIRKKDAIVNQAVMVMPPYTNKLSDYFESPGKIRNVITVTQYPDDNALLRVQGTLESADGGIVIGSAQHAISVQIKGTPSGNRTIFAPYTLTYNELRDIFKEPMNYQGVTREQVLREGLPEGSYRLCFKLYDAQMTRLLSQACSPPFMVTPPVQSALEPPQIILPHDGSELPPEQKQTVQFTWTMPPGAPATTQYTIKIIELNDRYANYRDMLRNSSYPAFFETTVRGVPTYLYTPANPAFQEGKTYAWVVRAVGNELSTIAVVPGVTFKNDGYSEPAVFTFKKSEPVKVQPPVNPEPPKETPPVVTEEGLKIFVPGCRNCDENFEGLAFDIPQGGSTYSLQGHTLNPNALSGPNAAADPKGRGRKKSNTAQTADLGSTTLAGGARTKIDIPADAIAVSNARNFYLRWEDKSSLLAKRQPKPGEGIVYRLQIREAGSQRVVWEKEVWNRNSYEQTKKGLPFVDGQSYVLHVAALRGVPTPNGFAAVIDVKGQPETLASSCQCEFTYMELEDVPDLVEYTVKGKLLYKFEHHPEKYPLTTTTATLTRYVTPVETGSGTGFGKGKVQDLIKSSIKLIPTPNDDRHSVPVKINDDGTFEATVYAYPDNGLLPSGNASPLVAKIYQLRELFKLELNSPYYRTRGGIGEPSVEGIVHLTDSVIDLGEITYNVWSYTLEVEVSKGYSEFGKVKGTYRELNPPHVKGQVKRVMFGLDGYKDVPYYEGDILPSQPKNQFGKSLITEGKVEMRKGDDGKERTYITFDRLICNFRHNDHYHVLIEQELEENGRKKTYYTNEFSRTGKYLDFKYIPTDKEMSGFNTVLSNRSNFLVKRKAVLLDNRPPRSTVKGKLVFADPCVDKNKTQPLANTDVALVGIYLIEDGKGHSTVADVSHIKEAQQNGAIQLRGRGNQDDEVIGEVLDELENRNKVLAVTRTDANGNFEFKDFVRIDSTFSENFKGEASVGPSEHSRTFNIDGRIRYTVRVVVNNDMKHRWLNPSKNIEIQPNNTMDVGELKAYIDSYLLWVKPIGDPDRNDIDMQNLTLKGAWVEIARDKTYDSEAGGSSVVERQQVREEKGIAFSVPRHTMNGKGNLNTLNDIPNDIHIMTFTSDSTGEHAFYPDRILYPKNYIQRKIEEGRKEGVILLPQNQTCPEIYQAPGEYHFTSDFKRIECTVPISMTPKNPIVSGRLLDSENMMRGVDGTVYLCHMSYNYYGEKETKHYDDYFEKGFFGNWLGYRKTSASNHGYFVFDNLNLTKEITYDNPEYKKYKEMKNKVSGLPGVSLGPEPPMFLSKEVQSEYALRPDAPGYSLLRAREQKGLKDTADVELSRRVRWFPEGGFTLKMGQQLHYPQILMQPNGIITGYVVAEKGLDGTPEKTKKADVRSTRSRLIETDDPDQLFAVRVPTRQPENADTLFVIPRDLNYFPDTIPLPGLTDADNTLDLGKIVVKERRHRIRIVVCQKMNRPLISISGDPLEVPGVEGVTVKIDASDVDPKVTNEQGIAEFEFTNTGKNFRYELIPPDDSDYIASSGELTNHESKEMTTYYCQMRKGATVSGRVTSDGKPVPGAKIWVMNGNDKRQVTADADGRYTLRGIKTVGEPIAVSTPTPASTPAKGKAKKGKSGKSALSKTANVAGNLATNVAGKVSADLAQISTGKYYATIHCGAPDDNEEYANLLGKDTEVTFANFDGKETVDFDLDIFYKANIGTLHGFKVTVTDVQEDGGDNYRITGTLHLDKTPGRFAKKGTMDQNPAFKGLKVSINNSETDAKGRPYFEVPGEAFSIGMKQMNVTLEAGGTPLKPSSGKGSKRLSVASSLSIRSFRKHTYSVQLKNAGNAFLKIVKDGLTGGFIRSKAQIEPESFTFTSANFKFERDQFYLSEAGDGQPNGQVTSFKSYVSEEKMNAWETEAGEGREYLLHTADRKPLSFTFVTFDATSPVAQSRLGTDGVIRLKPDVWFINPLFEPFNRKDTLRLNLPEVAITPHRIEGDVELDKLDLKFENWIIEVRNCQIDASKGGIFSNEAVIRTGSLDLRATTFVLNKDVFKLDGFDPKRIPLGKEVSQIDLSPGVEFQFGADPKCGSDLKPHLKLSLKGDPAGSIKNLPGFDQPIGFQTISLLSSGESIISFAPDCKALRLYDVVDFHPLTINSYDDGFNLDGTIDFGIPLFPTSCNYKLMFKKERKGLKLDVLPSNLQFQNVGTFKSLMERNDDQIFKDGLAELHGTIEEPGKLAPIRVVVWKRRTSPGKYRIWMDLEDREKPKQSICLGGQPGSGDAEFLVEKAGMVVDSKENEWDLLSLKLVPAGGYGDNSGFGKEPLYFVLAGDLRTETDIDREKRHIRIKNDDPNKEGDAWRTVTDIDFKKQQIKVAGTDRDPQQEGVSQDGFTGFVFVYDHPNRQLIGDMTITEKKIAGAKFSGDLRMVVGRPGFYFMGAGEVSVPVVGMIRGSMIFGYYKQEIPKDVWVRILEPSARKEVPCSFTGDSFKGFYAMGAMAIPGFSPIDEGGEFLGFGYKFLFDVGVEAAFWGNFGSKPQIGVSAMLYANIAASVSVPCVTLGVGVQASIKGFAMIDFYSPYTATLGLCGELTAQGCLKVDCLVKDEISKSITAHAGIEASLDLKKPTSPSFKPSFGWGPCSSGSKANCPVEVEKEGSLCD
ncbi:TANFOR domain-containing protein [Tannerella forsythia]|uniref:TANFOR domain-containing protein n=1 Tax=Tannerella forsythia TaxID=28112 RepID=A0A3P1XN78_TANFO|nr:TANFOR domain-containing protein [Tannerella forsythia]RRD58363.1 TANFOR domain-containing protein [Tannerella forsythia]